MGPMRTCNAVYLEASRVHTIHEATARIIDKGHSPCHACAEIVANFTKDNNLSPRHVFTRICAGSFDHSRGPRIADT